MGVWEGMGVGMGVWEGMGVGMGVWEGMGVGMGVWEGMGVGMGVWLVAGCWLARPRHRRSRRGARENVGPQPSRTALSVPPGWAEAGSKWQHPAPPGAAKGRVSRGGEGELRMGSGLRSA